MSFLLTTGIADMGQTRRLGFHAIACAKIGYIQYISFMSPAVR